MSRQTKIIAHSPTTVIEFPKATYMITLNKRIGMWPKEAYDAEILRLVAMAMNEGVKTKVTEYEVGEEIA